MVVRQIDGNTPEIRDLSDFCLRWPDLREIVLRREREGFDPDDPDLRAVLRWLRLLADRICCEEIGCATMTPDLTQ